MNINVNSLPFVLLEDRDELPEVSGIYFAIANGEVLQYIGLTHNLKIRWETHHHYKTLKQMGEVRIAYLLVPDMDELETIEKQLISQFNPPLNKPKFGGRRGNQIRYGVGNHHPQIRIHVFEKEAEHLKQYCEATQRTQNDVLRQLIRRLSVSGVLNPID